MRENLAAYANELLSLGTDGFRLDAAKREEKQFHPLFPVASGTETHF